MSRAKNRRVSSVANFVSTVWQLKTEWFPNEPTWGPWFRGHTLAAWNLAPKLYRSRSTRRPVRLLEDEIRQEFTMRAPGLTGLSEEMPQNSWEWYFTMQHAGAPTRLLDWTEGALLALYFAVRDSKGTEDACVWTLDPWWLNEKVLAQREVVAPGATVGISLEDASRYAPWLPDRYAKDDLRPEPVAVYPSHTARRISTQRSCFTVHGVDVEGLDKLQHQEDARLVRVTIAGSATERISRQLAVCGIDEVTIFPDLDGLGRLLSAVLKVEENGD